MESAEEKKKVTVPKTAAERQRYKLEKLMKRPEKDVFIPEAKEAKLPRVFNPPEFLRNVWGSSAGAGSGDFHVYRGVRRRENARQKFINEMAEIDGKDAQYGQKVEQNIKEAEQRTAKKRAKRMKKKQKAKQKKPAKDSVPKNEDDSEDEEDEDEDQELRTQKIQMEPSPDCLQSST